MCKLNLFLFICQLSKIIKSIQIKNKKNKEKYKTKMSEEFIANYIQIESNNIEKINNSNQLKHNCFIFNQKEKNNKYITYECQKKRLCNCKCKLKFNIKDEVYYLIGNHCHPPNKQNIEEISEQRKEELINFIKNNPHERRFHIIQKQMNDPLTESEKRDSKQFITIQDIKNIKEKHFYNEKFKFSDLYSSYYSKTISNEYFLNYVQIFPKLIIIWSSQHMQNIANDIREYDEIFIDGTFQIVLPGVSQLLVVMTKKKNDD